MASYETDRPARLGCLRELFVASVSRIARSEGGVVARLPPIFGALLGLAIILPFLNFLRTQPFGDFFSDWVGSLATGLAALAVTHRLPRKAYLNWSVLVAPGLIVLALGIQVTVGMYSYAADWIFWLAFLTVASLPLLIGQLLIGEGTRYELARRVAWGLVLAALVNFLLQVLQAARIDVEWRPFVVYLQPDARCQLYGNVGQTNHANSLAWLAIAGVIYLLAANRIGPRIAAALVAILLLSSALTASRMAWLFLAATVALLAIRHIWSKQGSRSRAILAMALIAGFLCASWGAAAIRAKADPACVSGIDRLTEVKESGNVIRPLLWKQAITVWKQSPWFGHGAGGFIGAVYRSDIGEGQQPLDSWVHNTALQLLAEFGAVVLFGIGIIFLYWLAMLVKRRSDLDAVDGLCISGLTILSIHSLLEFPLWYMHFLVLASIFVGLLVRPNWSQLRIAVPARAAVLVIAVLTVIGSLAVVIDYRKLDRLHWISELIQGIGAERVPDAQQSLEDAATVVHLFSQHRDYSLALGRPLGREDLERKIDTVERAMNRMPNVNLVHLRILLAILADDPETARSHMRRVFKFHAQYADAVVKSMRLRIEARPNEFGALLPILEEEVAQRPQRRW